MTQPAFPIKSVAEIIAEEPRFTDLAKRFPFVSHTWFVNGQAMNALLNQLRPRILCEVGSWMGGSARFQASPPFVEKIVCVDHWDRTKVENWTPGAHPEEWMDHMYEHFLANAVHTNFSQKICPVRMESTPAAAYLASTGVKFDWIYLDGAHATVAVLADIRNYLPLLAPNGFMCGDDWTYVNEPENVRGAVMNMAPQIGAQVHAHGNLWWYTFPNRGA